MLTLDFRNVPVELLDVTIDRRRRPGGDRETIGGSLCRVRLLDDCEPLNALPMRRGDVLVLSPARVVIRDA